MSHRPEVTLVGAPVVSARRSRMNDDDAPSSARTMLTAPSVPANAVPVSHGSHVGARGAGQVAADGSTEAIATGNGDGDAATGAHAATSIASTGSSDLGTALFDAARACSAPEFRAAISYGTYRALIGIGCTPCSFGPRRYRRAFVSPLGVR